MTTRRDLLTGIASVPIAATVPALPAAASTVGDRLIAFYNECAAETPAPPIPQFIHETDRQAFVEIESMERLVEAMKARLLDANSENPMIRYGGLFDMRNSLSAARMTLDGLQGTAETQRTEAHEARLAEEIRREAEGLPHTAAFVSRHRGAA